MTASLWPRRMKVFRASCGFCDGSGIRMVPPMLGTARLWSPYERVPCRSCRGQGRVPLVVEQVDAEDG